MGTAVAFTGLLAFTVACYLVGARLLLRWFRTLGMPELGIGVGFLFGGLQQTLQLLWPLYAAANEIESWLPAPLELLNRVLHGGSCLGILIVVLSVFRPKAWWKRLLAIVILVQLGTYVLRGPLLGDLSQADLVRHPLYWWDTFGQIAVYAWAAIESLLYQNTLRRRRRLGVGVDGFLIHRMLLWGIGLGAVAAMYSAFELRVLSALAGFGDFSRQTNPWVVSGFGLLCAATLYLAFFPPRGYRRRFSRNG